MKRSRYTEQQVIFILLQGELGASVEEENYKLKKLVADLSLDKVLLQDALF